MKRWLMKSFFLLPFVCLILVAACQNRVVSPTAPPIGPQAAVPQPVTKSQAKDTTCGLIITDNFADDIAAGRNVPLLADTALSGPFGAINECRPSASGKNVLRDRDVTKCTASSPSGPLGLDITDGAGDFVTFEFDLPSGTTVPDGSTVAINVVAFGGDGGHLFKSISEDGVNFTAVGDSSDTMGNQTFSIPSGGTVVYLKVQSGTTAGIYEGIWVNNPTLTLGCGATPSPSPSPSVSETPSVSVTPSVSETPSMSVTPSASETPSVSETPSPSASPSVSVTPSVSETPSPSVSETPSVSVTPSASPSPSATCDPNAAYKSIGEDAGGTLPPKFSNGINQILKTWSIPLQVTEASYAFQISGKDCCFMNTQIPNGDTFEDGSFGLQLSAQMVPLLPTDIAIDREINLGFTTVDLTIDYGLFANLTSDVSGKGGARTNQCDNVNCPFFSLDAQLTPSLDLEANVASCFSSDGQKYCSNVGVTGTASTSIGISGGYNENKCGNGWGGSIFSSGVVGTIKIALFGYNESFSREFLPGSSLELADVLSAF